MPVSVVELASHRRTQRLLHELAAHDEGSAVAPEELHVEAEGRRLASVELPLSAPLSVALPRRARSLTVVDDEGLVRASILRAELGAPHELEIAPGLTLSIGQNDHGIQLTLTPTRGRRRWWLPVLVAAVAAAAVVAFVQLGGDEPSPISADEAREPAIAPPSPEPTASAAPTQQPAVAPEVVGTAEPERPPAAPPSAAPQRGCRPGDPNCAVPGPGGTFEMAPCGAGDPLCSDIDR